MKTVAHRRNSHPERLRPLDRERHGLLPGELAKRMPRIQHHRGLPIGNHGTRCFGRDRSMANSDEIHVHEHDAVRGLALKISIDQGLGDGVCIVLRNARRHKHPHRQGA